jgi:hypothetical protein
MRYRVVGAAAIMSAAVVVGCAGEEGGCPDGASEFVVESGGRTAVYRGCEVTRQLRETGSFEPESGDAYDLIEVPSKLVPSDPADPTTVSLCDAAWEVRVEFHAGYCWGSELPDRNNPVVTAASPDDCIVHGESGQTGVFGRVQIVRQPDGHLTASHAFYADVYYESERGTVDGYAYTYGSIGVPDEDLEDPLLAEPCGCSLEEPCPRPEPPPGN